MVYFAENAYSILIKKQKVFPTEDSLDSEDSLSGYQGCVKMKYTDLKMANNDE